MLASAQGGRDAVLNRFLPSGDVSKGDVQDWVLENTPAETAQQNAILFWAKIAGWSAIAAVMLTALSLFCTIWFQK
jgi:hypothetical protein